MIEWKMTGCMQIAGKEGAFDMPLQLKDNKEKLDKEGREVSQEPVRS